MANAAGSFLLAAEPDLAELVRNESFRLDLYQREAGVVITLPALAERDGDFMRLARHFAGLRGVEVVAEIGGILASRPWPGNVRELRAAIDRAAHLAGNGVIDVDTVLRSLSLGPPAMYPEANGVAELEQERRAMLEVCERGGRHAGRIARDLGIGRATLYRRLRRLGISLKQRSS